MSPATLTNGPSDPCGSPTVLPPSFLTGQGVCHFQLANSTQDKSENPLSGETQPVKYAGFVSLHFHGLQETISTLQEKLKFYFPPPFHQPNKFVNPGKSHLTLAAFSPPKGTKAEIIAAKIYERLTYWKLDTGVQKLGTAGEGIHIGSLGQFDHNILYIGLKDTNNIIKALRHVILEVLKQHSASYADRFSPHVTLARYGKLSWIKLCSKHLIVLCLKKWFYC